MLLRLSDWVFVGLGVSLLFLDTRADGLLALTGILPLLWLGLGSALRDVPARALLALAMLCQLALTHALLAVISSPPDGFDPFEPATEPAFWAGILALSIAVFARLSSIKDICSLVERLHPFVLLACFAALTVDKFSGLGGDGCRVSGLTRWPFTPALFFTVFTLMSFVTWPRLDRRGQYVRLGLIAAAVLLANGYAGTRFIALVQIACFLALAALFAVREPVGIRRPGLMVLVAIGGGLVASLLVDAISGCSLLFRFGEVAVGLQSRAALPEGSGIALRLEFVDTAIAVIREAPWTGYGIWAEEAFVSGSGHTHVHNQYLSWMIWGGVPILFSGLVFLFSPLIVVVMIEDGWQRSTLALTVLGPMPLAMVADTFLRLDTFLNLHIFSACLVTLVACDKQNRKTC